MSTITCGNRFFTREDITAFPNTHLCCRLFHRKSQFIAVGLNSHAQGFAIFSGIRAQRVLDAITKLAKNILWNVGMVLGDTIYADALGRDKPDNLFNFVHPNF